MREEHTSAAFWSVRHGAAGMWTSRQPFSLPYSLVVFSVAVFQSNWISRITVAQRPKFPGKSVQAMCTVMHVTFSNSNGKIGYREMWFMKSNTVLTSPLHPTKKKKIIQLGCIVMEKHAMLTFSNFSAYSVWLEVKYKGISELLIHAGGGEALGCSSLVCSLAAMQNCSTTPLGEDFKLNKQTK